jgi:transposase
MFVGIDVSGHRLDVHLRPSGAAFEVPRDDTGIAALVERLGPVAPALIMSEATGDFESAVAAGIAVRNVLYMAALTAVCWNPSIRDLYLRLRGRGRPAKSALATTMRKLLTVLNAILRDAKPWQNA